MMAVVICAVVTMAATGSKDGDFDMVTARSIYVTNDAGNFLVALGPNKNRDGLVATRSPKSRHDLVVLTSSNGGGSVTTYQPNGKELVALNATDNGGLVEVSNKTGKPIVSMLADEYGNGVIGAWNRKGKGKTLQPGP
jgi:hypothetical protein